MCRINQKCTSIMFSCLCLGQSLEDGCFLQFCKWLMFKFVHVNHRCWWYRSYYIHIFISKTAANPKFFVFFVFFDLFLSFCSLVCLSVCFVYVVFSMNDINRVAHVRNKTKSCSSQLDRKEETLQRKQK